MCLSVASSRFAASRDILIDGFVPPATSVAPMFPFYENSAEWDDYGEIINPDDYIIKDEDMDQPLAQVSMRVRINTALQLQLSFFNCSLV